MKGKWKWMSTILIIVLIGILVGVLVRFYTTPITVNTPIVMINYPTKQPNTNHPNPIIANKSGNTQDKTNEGINLERTSSGESQKPSLTTPTAEPKKTPKSLLGNSIRTEKKEVQEDTSSKGSQVIISSEDTMTNKEKRDILTELDNTLMELLEVVDKVQPVDETRLMTEESEVQK